MTQQPRDFYPRPDVVRAVTPYRYDTGHDNGLNMLLAVSAMLFAFAFMFAAIFVAASEMWNLLLTVVAAGAGAVMFREMYRLADARPSRLGYLAHRLLGKTETTELYRAMKGRPHATEQGDPHFVLSDLGQDGRPRMRLICAPRHALSRSCHDFDARVIRTQTFEPGAEADEVVQAALSLDQQAQDLELQSHLKAQEAMLPGADGDDAAQDTLMLMRAALGNKD